MWDSFISYSKKFSSLTFTINTMLSDWGHDELTDTCELLYTDLDIKTSFNTRWCRMYDTM
jgi:hypothetical protein